MYTYKSRAVIYDIKCNKKVSANWLLNKVFRPIARHHISQRILHYFNNCPWLSDEQYIRKHIVFVLMGN